MIKKQYYVTPKSGIRVAKKGIFKFDELCDVIKSWGKSRHYDFTEKENKTKHFPRGKEIVRFWFFNREINDYMRFNIRLSFFITDFNSVKLNNKLLDKADMEIKLFSFIEFDYKKKWTGFLKEFLINVYNNYIIKDRIINVYEVKLYSELMELHDEIKDSIEMYK